MEKPPDPIENVKSSICPAKFSWLIRDQSPFGLNYWVTRAFQKDQAFQEARIFSLRKEFVHT